MPSSQSLPVAVKALEDKAKEHKQAQNTQYHVSVARYNIMEVNNELDELTERLRDLAYYKTVLEKAFNSSVPTNTNRAIQAAKRGAAMTQSDLLEKVTNIEVSGGNTGLDDSGTNERNRLEVQLTPGVETYIKHLQSANRQVENIINTVKSRLKDRRDEWRKMIGAAEELQKIIGSQNSDFARTLDDMHILLTRNLMDSNGSASDFVLQWNNALNNWEKYQSLQSFDDFQETHELSDVTIKDVKTLSKSQNLTLADVSLDSLEEMKRVNELESAVELSL